MKKHLVSVALCSLLSSAAFAQDIQSYVAHNTSSIARIDPESSDFTDLDSVGRAIGEARVVMLGEQDHGDASTFLAKTRLVKYLHEQKGFNVLAFESDFYGLTEGWQSVIKQPDSIRTFLKKNILSLWTRSDACQYLFNTYIPISFQTQRPLYPTGFDSQPTLDYSLSHLKNDLDQYLRRNQWVQLFSEESAYQSFLDAVQYLLTSVRNPAAFEKATTRELTAGLQLIRKAQLQKQDSAYWRLVIDNLIALATNSRESSEQLRDEAMANNLRFLLTNTYKGEKIIVWAANTHVMKYTNQLKGKSRDFRKVILNSMGTAFTTDSLTAQSTYVLGFTSYQGSAGRLGSSPFVVQLPDPNGLENWIPKGVSYGFIDFRAYNAHWASPKVPFLMKGPMHFTIPQRIVQIPWNLAYDGIFFVREMHAVKKVE